MAGRADEIQAIMAAFKTVHPGAEECHEWNLDGLRIKVQDTPLDWKGTADPEHLVMLPVERAAGITVHLWDPRQWELLKGHEKKLQDAGFKVMVGCMQWNRKAAIDVEALRAVFEATL